MVFSWGGNPGVGSLHRFRDAYEKGWPRPLEIEEHSHAAMANAYEAGAAGLPFAVFRGYRGAELPRVNPNIKSVTCPYTGEVLATVPAMRLDSAVIHAQKADRAGNVLLEGIVGVQKEAVLAAKRSLVTVEEIVDDLGPRSFNACILPHWTVTAIALVPGGAHPSYAQGYYKRDNAFYEAWDEIARDRDSFKAWMEENVLQEGPGGLRRLRPQVGKGRAAMSTAAKTRLDADRDDDHRRRARAQEQRRVLRRHRRAVGRVQPGAPHACAGHHADLRERHHRHQAQRAAALDRRRRAVRDGAHHRVGAGDVPLLAAGRPHHRRLPRRRADRPLRQPQHHRRSAPYDKPKVRLPGGGGAPEIATSCARGVHHHGAGQALVRRQARFRHLARPRRGQGQPREARRHDQGADAASSPTCACWSPTRRPRS